MRMNFYNAQCWLPCARLNPVARIPWAPSTVQIFESHSNRLTFETNTIMVIVKVHPLY